MEPLIKISVLRYACYLYHNGLLSFLLIIAALFFISTPGIGQVRKRINPEVYERVIKPNTTVEVNTMKNGKVNETNTVPIKEVQIVANSRTVIPYEKKISVIDAATYKKVLSNSGATGAIEDYKIIPELHIVTSGAEQEAFRIVFTLTRPFRYNYEQKVFNATMGFFLLPETENSTSTVIDPVNIEIVSNVAKTIIPEELNIVHLNLPSSKVELAAENISDSTEVKVITASNPGGYKTYLKVEPTLELKSERTSLQGYGIQTIPVQVRFIGSNSPNSATVNFNVSKGSVTPASMDVSYNKPATIYIRSEGTGEVKLSASTNSADSNELSFTYKFPWPFLLFSMIGGLIGGLIKYYFTSDENKFVVKHIIGGIFIGFIVAVAYYFLGVNLIGLSLNAGLNEMAVLGLSALGAYFGIISPKPPAPKP